MATIEEVQQAEITDLSVRKRVEAFYKGTDAIAKFAQEVMIPMLRGQLNLNDKERAITGIYYRMYLWIPSMVTMNSRIHFQGAASAARSLFELLLDIKLLDADTTGEMVAKFHVFPKVERFRVAQNIVSFNDKNPDSTIIVDTHQRNLVNKPGKVQEIEETITTHWGTTKSGHPRHPDHWSGMNMKESEVFWCKV